MEKLDDLYQWLDDEGVFLFDRQLPFSNVGNSAGHVGRGTGQGSGRGPHGNMGLGSVFRCDRGFHAESRLLVYTREPGGGAVFLVTQPPEG